MGFPDVSFPRAIVNFDYWRLRAEVEQSDQALSARKMIYQGDRTFHKGDMVAARAAYEQGLAGWRKVPVASQGEGFPICAWLSQATHLFDEITPGDDLVVLHQGRVLEHGQVAQVIADAGTHDVSSAFMRLTEAAPKSGSPAA